jgi:hypothetical protein
VIYVTSIETYRTIKLLLVAEDIQFADTPTVERHRAGESALLQCVATGQPAPEVTWRFNRRRIVPGPTVRSFYDYNEMI